MKLYTIEHKEESNVLVITNANELLHAKIHLDKGASLQELTLNGRDVIVDLDPLEYKTTYASAILFPFANRIKDGEYQFNGVMHQLEKNQEEEQNALHGLVYNKTFKILELKNDAESASVKLEYNESNASVGFPFTFNIQLEYLFSRTSVVLKVNVKNTDTKPYPYTLGWHPYFKSSDLGKSSLNFKSNEKIILGERNITTGIERIEHAGDFDLKDKELDDCWILNSNQVKFLTPNYNFIIESSEENNCLQAYTPPKKNIIAIEPTTGVSDSFNNKIGLQELNPNETYTIEWRLKLI